MKGSEPNSATSNHVCRRGFKTGYISLAETGGRGAVQAVQLKGSDNVWQPLNNVWGAAWESSNMPAGPISFRFVPDQGGEVGVVFTRAALLHQSFCIILSASSDQLSVHRDYLRSLSAHMPPDLAMSGKSTTEDAATFTQGC